MRAKTERLVSITLELTEAEAVWLKVNMQNPLHGQLPEEELDEDTDYRERFFNCLSASLEV